MLWMIVMKLLFMLCCGLHDAANGCGEIAVYVVVAFMTLRMAVVKLLSMLLWPS
jgi:hypothetical protein